MIILQTLLLVGVVLGAIALVNIFYRNIQIKSMEAKNKVRFESRVKARMKSGFSREKAEESVKDFDKKLGRFK